MNKAIRWRLSVGDRNRLKNKKKDRKARYLQSRKAWEVWTKGLHWQGKSGDSKAGRSVQFCSELPPVAVVDVTNG